MRRQTGFTFLEITIVVVIVMVLAAVALPSLKGAFYNVRTKSGARNVTGLLRYARAVAILRELPCQVIFNPQKDTYQLVLLDEDGDQVKERNTRRRNRDKPEFSVGDDVRGERKLPKGVHFAAIYTAAPLTEDKDLPCVIYYPDGSATPATVAIQDEKKQTISVEVYRTTGMAKVEKGLPAEEPKVQTIYYGPGNKRVEVTR